MSVKITTAALVGKDGVPIFLEVEVSNGIPYFTLVGLADKTIQEAKERVKAALNTKISKYPNSKITVSLTPGWIRKKGTHFDLPMAVAILAASGQLEEKSLKDYAMIGELSLDGSVNGVRGILPMVIALKKKGVVKIILPYDNWREGSLVKGIKIYPVKTIEEIILHLREEKPIKEPKNSDIRAFSWEISTDNLEFQDDFKDVKGQEYAKRGVLIGVAGGHGIILKGSPSTGKTMLAKRIPGILPPMTLEEIIEVTSIYSIVGLLKENTPLVVKRPFRNPNQRITIPGLIGGGSYPIPGEITLANKGILFLDEIGEFKRDVIDSLRVPLESKEICLFRKGEKYIYPADFILVAATNLCKCGYYLHPTKECSCTPREIEIYNSKISGPITERIDMSIYLTPVNYEDLKEKESMSSLEMREIVQGARLTQYKRFRDSNINLNSQMTEEHISKYYFAEKEGENLLEAAFRGGMINPRTLLRVKRVSQTIADIEGSKIVKKEHIGEALQYRGKQND